MLCMLYIKSWSTFIKQTFFIDTQDSVWVGSCSKVCIQKKNFIMPIFFFFLIYETTLITIFLLMFYKIWPNFVIKVHRDGLDGHKSFLNNNFQRTLSDFLCLFKNFIFSLLLFYLFTLDVLAVNKSRN